MYRNALRPSTRFALVLLVLATSGMLIWLDLLIDENTTALDISGLMLLGFTVVSLALSAFLFARVRWARIAASIALHVEGLACIVGVVAMSIEDDTLGSGLTATGLAVFVAGLFGIGILTLHGESMREDMAPARDPEQARLRRRRARGLTVVLVGLIVASMSWVVWRVVPLLLAKPTITVDYLAAANRSGYPPDYDPNLDAAPYYERLFVEFVPLPEDLAGKERVWPAELEEEQLETLRQWASSNETAQRVLAEAAQCPYWYYELSSSDGSLVNLTVPYLPEMRQWVFGFLLIARDRASQGDVPGAVDLLLDAHMIGVHRARGGTLLEQMVGNGICKVCEDSLLAILTRCDVGVATLKEALATLTAREPHVAMPRFAEAEHLLSYDAIQRAFSDNGRGNGRLLPGLLYEAKKDGGLYSGSLTYLDALWICLGHPDRAETLRVYDRYWQAVSQLADQSPYSVFRSGSSYESEIDEMLAGAYCLHDGYQAIAGGINLGWRNRAQSRAVEVVLAAFICKAETGQWPSTLGTLVESGYLQEVPVDPYSDEPLVYRVEGESFILYSVGEDFFDNGGVDVPWGQSEFDGDRVFWPVRSDDPITN